MAVAHRSAWTLAPPEPAASALAEALGISPLAAGLLCRRGCVTVDAARAFLTPRLADLTDPSAFPGMEEAAALVAAAVRAGRPIAIHGDYDVDGISATAILVRALRGVGAAPAWRLPHRIADGYGLGVRAVEELAAAGAGVLIAADCGITALEAVSRARALGMDVVILDHHAAGDRRPPAIVVESDPEPATITPPCAAGLAFFFTWALRRCLGVSPPDGGGSEPPADLAALAALGTVADVVPLLGDNRRLASAGLAQLRDAPSPGLRALLEAAGITGPVDAWHIGWQIGPRLNAPGRLGDPAPALRLLLTEDPAEARDLARVLDDTNRERQAILDRALTEAAAQLEGDPNRPAIVVAGEGWHPGVVGLVAGRLVEAYGRPAVAIALAADGARGSARSVPGFHLVEALGECGEHLTAYGGHAMAAGLSLPVSAIEAFREAFTACARRQAPREAARLTVDAEVALGEVTPALVADLALLAPFGSGNPQPVFAIRGVRPVARRLLGDGAHLSFGVTDGTVFLDSVGFAMGEWADVLTLTEAAVDLAFTPEADRMTPGRIRLRVRALDAPGVDPETVLRDTGLLVDRLFRRAADFLGDARYGGVEDLPAFYTKVVGVTFEDRPAVAATLRPGDALALRREPANPHDPHAIALIAGGGRAVGFLNAQLAGRLAPAIDAGARYRATVSGVTGGGDRAVGVNVYLERAGEEPDEPGQPSDRRAAAGGWRTTPLSLDHLPILLNAGRPFPPAVADALASLADGRSAILGTPPGRSRTAAVAAAAALGAGGGRLAVVAAATPAQVRHRASQCAARLAPLGLRVVGLHGLLDLREREHAMAALRSGGCDVLVLSVEMAREGDLLAPHAGRISFAIADGIAEADWDVLSIGGIPSGRGDASTHAGGPGRSGARPVVLVAVDPRAARAAARRFSGATVVHGQAAGALLTVQDRRDPGLRREPGRPSRERVVEEVVAGGEKTAVYVSDDETCVALAGRLRPTDAAGSRRVAYLHAGLPPRLRRVIEQAFREGRLDVLVTTDAVDEDAWPPDVRQVVLASVPPDQDRLRALLGAAGGGRRPAAATLAFGAGDRATDARRLAGVAPGRDLLASIYRALRDRHGPAPFAWPDDEAWERLAAAVPGVSRDAVAAACEIFEQVGLAAAERGPQGWQVRLVPEAQRRDLRRSARYRDGRRESQAFAAGAAWALGAPVEEIRRSL